MRLRSFVAFALLFASVAQAESLEAMLRKGEVTLLETYPDGRLKQATAIGLVQAPIEAVWAQLTDFQAYPQWMPKVESVEVTVLSPTVSDVTWSLGIAGPNVKYTGRYTMDKDHWAIRGVWVGGELQGSRWDWRLESAGAATIVYREVYSNVVGSNWLIEQVEDSEHTLEYGINSASGVIEIQGLKRALAGR